MSGSANFDLSQNSQSMYFTVRILEYLITDSFLFIFFKLTAAYRALIFAVNYSNVFLTTIFIFFAFNFSSNHQTGSAPTLVFLSLVIGVFKELHSKLIKDPAVYAAIFIIIQLQAFQLFFINIYLSVVLKLLFNNVYFKFSMSYIFISLYIFISPVGTNNMLTIINLEHICSNWFHV